MLLAYKNASGISIWFLHTGSLLNLLFFFLVGFGSDININLHNLEMVIKALFSYFYDIYSSSFLIALARTSRSLLNKNIECGPLLPHLWEPLALPHLVQGQLLACESPYAEVILSAVQLPPIGWAWPSLSVFCFKYFC